MASEGQPVGQDPCWFSQKYVDKKVSSVLRAAPSSSKNLEPNTEFSGTGLDGLHGSKTNAFSSKSYSSSNSKEKLNPVQNSMGRKGAMDDSMSRKEQPALIHSQFSSSSNFVGQPFSHGRQAPQHGYGNFPFRDARAYHNSATPSPSHQPRERRFIENSQASSELIRGPRANKMHFPSSAEKNELGPLISRDQFNKSDFQIKYEHAKFFMIKSFSEDDIHKSIKYNVWASTSYGNQKLQAAYKDAQEKMSENVLKCPVFLFFSVNASGQFVGLAEMIGPVDFIKTMEFWQKGKWNGFFPVKWHIIKDIPNKYFQHITLENNDNKPVTFSRDTQEIGLPQGLKMLQYFKSYPLARSLLDDFDFYEQKERSVNNQRTQQQSPQTEANLNHNSFPWQVFLEEGFGQMSISSPEY